MTDQKIKPTGWEVLRRRLIVGLLSTVALSKRKMALWAYQTTDLYKRLYGPIVGQKGRKQRMSRHVRFQDLPLLTKHEVGRAGAFDLLSRKLYWQVYKYGETTGSTGNPTPSFYTRKEFQGSVALSKLTPYADRIREALKSNRRAVCGLACGFTIAGPSFQQILDAHGFLTVNVDARTTIAPPERVARLLARFRPSVIAATETDFLAWMRVLKENHPKSYEPVVQELKVLLSTAELCSENRSRQIENAFQIIHVDNYACVEGYFSLACPCGEKHILPAYHTEVLSEDLENSHQYGKGRFVFTNLLRRSTPFVRYLLDDLVTIFPSDCPYGFKRSIIPHGRYELSVEIGGERYGTRDFENALFADHLFGEYVVDVRPDRFVVTAEDYGLGIGRIPVQQIQHRFRTSWGMPAELEIVPYGGLRDYREIRVSKPLLRLSDSRATSTQEVPRYL